MTSALASLPKQYTPSRSMTFCPTPPSLTPFPAYPAVSPVILLGQFVLIGVQTFDFVRPFTVQDKLSQAQTRPD